MSRWENLLYTRVIIRVNTILDRVDTRAICLGVKVLAWYIDQNGIGNKNIVKYPCPIGIRKWEILIKDTWIVFEKQQNKMTPDQHW